MKSDKLLALAIKNIIGDYGEKQVFLALLDAIAEETIEDDKYAKIKAFYTYLGYDMQPNDPVMLEHIVEYLDNDDDKEKALDYAEEVCNCVVKPKRAIMNPTAYPCNYELK